MPEAIRIVQDRLEVPDQPIIPFIVGDGIGSDITPAMQRVVDAALEHAYHGQRRIHWLELLAGEKAHREIGDYLPPATLERLRGYLVGIKGPLSTPVGSGLRSPNVAIRQILDLYSGIRPVRWYRSPSPLKHPEKMDLVVFRENTEDVYAGIEYASESPEARKVIELVLKLGASEDRLTPDAAVGIKPISPSRTKRHVRQALRWALDHQRRAVTFMHKGNIMKFTEGGFVGWGYQVLAEPEFLGKFVTEEEAEGSHRGKTPDGKLLVNDRIADNMFQQLLTRTEDYDLIVTTNLNGDYLSDAAAAAVGGLGMAPGANLGDRLAVFEATHGTAPKYAGRDQANPSSLILSAAMMLDYLGWGEAAAGIRGALEATLARRLGTYDLVRGWLQEGERDSHELSCSEFAAALVDHLR